MGERGLPRMAYLKILRLCSSSRFAETAWLGDDQRQRFKVEFFAAKAAFFAQRF